MAKQAISVTLESDNLLWLKAQTAASRARSVSETLDGLIAEARQSGGGSAAARSVVGTIDIAADDPDLAGADTVLRGWFGESLRRPVLVRESAPPYDARPRRRSRRG